MTHKSKHSVRRLGHLLVWMLRRAGLWYSNLVSGKVACSNSRAPRKAMVFENLEPRLLLSADLMPVALDTAPLTSANDSNIGAHVSIIVRNTGDALPDKPVIVNLYATPDAAPESNAVQVGSAVLDAASLVPDGADTSARIALDLASLTTPGSYTLRAEIDPDHQIDESNETNNQITLPAALNLAATFNNPAAGNVSVAFDPIFLSYPP